MTSYLTYKCDKCGKEWKATDKSEQIVAVGVVVRFGHEKLPSSPSSYAVSKSWCRTCVMKHGVKHPINGEDKKVAPNPAPSFEEVFAELIADLGFIRE